MLDRRVLLRRPRILSAAPSFWRGIFSSWHPGDSHSVPLIATTAATGRGGGQLEEALRQKCCPISRGPGYREMEDVRRRESREARVAGGRGDFVSSRHSTLDEDDDDVEVGCTGPKDSRRRPQRRLACCIAASGLLSTLVLINFFAPHTGGALSHQLAAWLSRRNEGDATAAVSQLDYEVLDHLASSGKEKCTFDALSAWATARGIEHDRIQAADFACATCAGGTRRGAKATKKIFKGDALVRAPWHATINAENPPNAALQPVLHLLRNASRIRAEDLLAVVLVFERFHASSSLRPWLCYLPAQNDSPIFWDDVRLSHLGPASEAAQRVGYFRHNLLNRYNAIFPQLFRSFPRLFHASVHTVEAWLWACAMVQSRNWSVCKQTPPPVLWTHALAVGGSCALGHMKSDERVLAHRFANLKRPPYLKHVMVPIADVVNHRLVRR